MALSSADLGTLEQDYAILCDQEYNVAYMVTLCKNTDELLALFKGYKSHIDSLVSESHVPEMNTYLDLSELESAINGIIDKNNSCKEEINNTLPIIDSSKERIAYKIKQVLSQRGGGGGHGF